MTGNPMGWRGLLVRAMAAGCMAAMSSYAAAGVEELQRCAPGKGRVLHALKVLDGMTIATAEGETVRLAGVVVSDEPDRGQRAADMLDAMVAGKKILLHAEASDRYARSAAQVALVEAADWIQSALISAGVVIAAPQNGGGKCVPALLAFERKARAAGMGLWTQRDSALIDSRALVELTAAEGRYRAVEGVVRRIGESGGRIYLDFGGRFTEDFSVIVPREAHKAFTSAGIDLRALEGVRLRVRGVVTMRGGPAIELRDPSAMEFLKDGV